MNFLKSFFTAAILTCIIAVLLPKQSSAQGISSNVGEGCAPLAGVQFNNSFTNPTGITWDFGDGASSNLANPTHSFANPGTFTVTFSATSGGAPVSATLTITVYAAPSVSFSVDPSGVCLGEPVQFSDESTGGSGSAMANWQWDFGDGSPISAGGANVSHTYTNPGQYNVTLIGTDANGCQSNSTISQAVSVSTPPTLNIASNPSPLLACEPPLVVTFTNNSTSNSPTGGGLTWEWNFGNGETSTSVSPQTTYNTTGTFTITATATDNSGCSATQNFPVTVDQPTAELTAQGGNNGVWCSFVQFEVEGTQGGQFSYGNGITGFNPFHTYSNPGTYNVTYNVTAQGCSASATTSVTIEIPEATITSDPGYACSKPAEFSYSVQSTSNIAEFEWELSNGETSEDPNPTQLVDYTGPNNYAINGLVLQTTILNFTTSNGCEGSATILDSLALPNALFYPDLTDGCAPLTVNFEDMSSNHFYHDLEEWEWHWGDGTVFNSAVSSDPTHTYTEEGEYTAFLIVTNDAGCIDTSFTHLIEVGGPVNNSFTFSPSNPCPGEPVQITNTSIDTDLIDYYNYVGDDNTLFSCAEEASPELVFNTVAGTFPVTQQAEYNGCISTSTQQITVEGPIGKVSHECNCDTPLDYTFEAEIYEADSWTWDFGDGTVIENSTATVQDHSYGAVGNYHVVLTSFSDGSGCAPYIDSLLIKVRNIEATLNAPEQVCAGTEIDLSVNETGGLLPGAGSTCYPRYLWMFNDGSRPSQTLTSSTIHIFEGEGSNVLEVYVKDENECTVLLSQEVEVFNITANYEADTLTGCPSFEVNFSDLSVSDTTIVNWNWDFGDGTGSSEQNPVHTFEDSNFGPNNQPLPYNVSLIVTDELGCEADIDVLVVQPLGPNPDFEAESPTNICVGDEVSFGPTASNINFHTYTWDYGNGTTSEGPDGSSIFSESGTFEITMEATDTTGCARARTIALVNVQDYPVALIDPDYGEGDILCYPVAVNFTDGSTTSPFGSRSWNLGIGGPDLSLPAVGTTYLTPGVYNVTLDVETTFGCADSDTLAVQVEGPVAEMEVDPLAICPGESIGINLVDTADLAFWEFDFGDGNDTTNVAPATHTYAETFIPGSGSTLITLVMYSPDSACASARTESLIIEQVIADFDRNNESALTDSVHCFGIPDNFINTSTPNAVTYNWSLSTGQNYTSANTPPVNLPPGDHTVTLLVTSALGCQDTISKDMTIHPLPEPTVNEGEICRGESIELTATGGVIYDWSPTTGIDFPQSPVVNASPETNTTYIVTVTDTNDCSQTVSSDVFVFQPPPSIERDTVLRIGDSGSAGLDIGPFYTYSWSPDIYLECDTCPVTVFTPLESTEYTLTIEDVQGCFSEDSYFYFDILPVASVDVPQAFSPNGDGINDVLFVNGWGIDELLSFRIYNRWGEMVYEGSNINEGWDGHYKGALQNPDSYAYVVVVKNYILEEPQTIKGFVDIVR